MKLVTGEEMRSMDKRVIEEFGLPGLVLMENAAAQIAEQIEHRFKPLAGQRIAIVCGKGNNGGDGIAAARHLKVRYNAEPIIWLVEPMDKATPDTSINLMAARNYGIEIESIADTDWFATNLKASHFIVDAVLGTGVEGNPRPAAAKAIDAINRANRPVVSVDVPSGLLDTGEAGSPAVQATFTVTLALPKLSLFLYPGLTLAGELSVVDISFPREVTAAEQVKTIAVDKKEVVTWLPRRSAGRDSNKGKFGSVTILAGSPGFLGAACLASEGAARAGAGLVTLGVPTSIFDPILIRAIDAVMIKRFPSSSAGSFDVSGLPAILEALKKSTSIGLGPGIGVESSSIEKFVGGLMSSYDKPMVIDADALTVLSQEPDHGASIVSARKAATVMTPHPGEMARLLGTDTKSVQSDRLGAVREASKLFNAVVVLKGQASLIASPSGELGVNTTGNPGMATGGSGDVLTGVTAAMLGQIDNPFHAACAAVFVHGLAGDMAAAEIGEAGLLATDIARTIPEAIKACYADAAP